MKLSAADKVRFLTEATRGAPDCHALRSFDPGREQPYYWRPVYAPVNEAMMLSHMAGEIEIGAYALVPGATIKEFPKCWWIAADFDGKRPGCDWQRDVQRFLSFLIESKADILVNRSRSGLGVHVRVLFKEPVPAWMARRWMNAWLEEASVTDDFDDGRPTSFDRTIPMQDTLRLDLTYDMHRRPGNLVGTPMHKGLADKNGGTLPISTNAAVDGNFEPDGQHWGHLITALDGRTWGHDELVKALGDAPGSPDTKPPAGGADAHGNRALTVLHGDAANTDLLIARRHCAFFEHMQSGGRQSYALWVALATQLHRFGAAGHDAFHEISALDPRYKAAAVEQKWDQTAEMHPNRCDTIAEHGWRCPHLDTKRCNGAKTPAFFPQHIGYEPL